MDRQLNIRYDNPSDPDGENPTCARTCGETSVTPAGSNAGGDDDGCVWASVLAPDSGIPMPIRSIVDMTKSGEGGLAEMIHSIRLRIAEGADPKGKEVASMKKELIAFNLGRFKDGYRDSEHFAGSRWMLFDLDGQSPSDLPAIRERVARMRGVGLCFISPTGTGLKFAILLDREIAEPRQFKRLYQRLAIKIEGLLMVKLDATSDAARACYISHDPKVFYSPGGEPFPVAELEEAEGADATRTSVAVVGPGAVASELPQQALAHISPERANDYTSWIQTGMSCKAAGLLCSAWETWSKQSPKYTEGECERKWETFTEDGGLGAGSLVTWADEDSPGWRERPAKTLLPELSPELIDLANGVEKDFGSPFFTSQTEKGEKRFNGLNESFWAGLHAAKHRELHDPNEQAFYQYDETCGTYVETSPDLIKQEISRDVLDCARRSDMESGLTKGRSNAFLWATVGQLRGIVERRDAFRSERKFIVLGNGVLVFPDDDGEPEFRSFSPDFYSRNASPICYLPGAACPRFLNELILPAVSADDAVLIQKYVGLCLLGRNLIQRFMILDGTPNGGKSSLSLTVQQLIGQQNCTQLRTAFLGDKFELFRMLRKTLLTGIDVDPDFLNMRGASVLKGLVGGDIFDAEQKGGIGSFPVEGTFCALITSNARLKVMLTGDVGAWKRRLLIVRYEKDPPKIRIPDFCKMLIREEGPGILNWAIEGLLALRRDIAAIGDIALNERQAGIVDALLCESDSLRHFLVAMVVRDDAAPGLTVQQIINAYAEYCPERGWSALPITVIQKQLEGLMLEIFRVSKSNSVRVDGKDAKGYRNVRFAKIEQI
jgi:phage/plasmid-associated DNA primase